MMHVKRVQLKEHDDWVWGLFASRYSLKPFMMSRTIRSLSHRVGNKPKALRRVK